MKISGEGLRKRIWWVASYPKSGSTWVRMLLNAYITGFPPDINSAWQYVTGDLQPSTYQITSAESLNNLVDTDIVYYRPAVLMNHILTSASRDLALKTHHAKVELDGIEMIPPRLSKAALYIIRDPRDVVHSFANHMGCTIDDAIEKMQNNQMTLTKNESSLYHVLLSWSAHVDSWTIHNKSVRTEVVKYEDLLEKPNRTWPLVLKAMGLEVDHSRLNEALDRCKFSELKKQEEDKGFRENGSGDVFFRKGKSGTWKNLLSPQQIRLVEDNHRVTMERWQYLSSPDKNDRNILGKFKVAVSGEVLPKQEKGKEETLV
jgi:hypothetical protein